MTNEILRSQYVNFKITNENSSYIQFHSLADIAADEKYFQEFDSFDFFFFFYLLMESKSTLGTD
jgi:hypothetical protein